jgi:hypothetical protein
MFRSLDTPTWNGWRECIDLYERQGSQQFKFPIRPEDAVPTGCPATLAYNDQNVIHDFMYESKPCPKPTLCSADAIPSDRVLCHSQLLHEKHGVKAHYTTTLDSGLDCCAVCEVTASYFLPALVGPYFTLRQQHRRQIGLDLSQTLEDSSPDGCIKTLLDLTSTPMEPNFPELTAPWPEKCKRCKPKKKITRAIVKPNVPRYLPTLLPSSRTRFVPRQPGDGLDMVRHPYSYFLSLNGEQRKLYLKAKVNLTRDNMGCLPIQEDEDTGGGSWKCCWLTLAEVGERVSEHIITSDGFGPLLKELRSMISSSRLNSGFSRVQSPHREPSTVFEMRGRNVSTQVLEMAVKELRKLTADQIAQMEWIRKQNAGGDGIGNKLVGVTNDVLDLAIAQLANIQAQETKIAEGVKLGDQVAGDAQPTDGADIAEGKKRKRRGRRKSRAANADNGAATEQACEC